MFSSPVDVVIQQTSLIREEKAWVKNALSMKLFFRRLIGRAIYFVKKISSEVQLHSQPLAEDRVNQCFHHGFRMMSLSLVRILRTDLCLVPQDCRELAEGFNWDKNICPNSGIGKTLSDMTY